MKLDKNRFKFLISIGFFLLIVGIATPSFSQYQTILEESDSLSVTPPQNIEEDSRVFRHTYHPTKNSSKVKGNSCTKQCSSGCKEYPEASAKSLGKCFRFCEENCTN